MEKERGREGEVGFKASGNNVYVSFRAKQSVLHVAITAAERYTCMGVKSGHALLHVRKIIAITRGPTTFL
jgi:hypothetical protein